MSDTLDVTFILTSFMCFLKDSLISIYMPSILGLTGTPALFNRHIPFPFCFFVVLVECCQQLNQAVVVAVW